MLYLLGNNKEYHKLAKQIAKKLGKELIVIPGNILNFKLEDLKGKSILAGRNGGMPLMMFEYALKEANIDKKEIDINTSVDSLISSIRNNQNIKR